MPTASRVDLSYGDLSVRNTRTIAPGRLAAVAGGGDRPGQGSPAGGESAALSRSRSAVRAGHLAVWPGCHLAFGQDLAGEPD